MNEYDIMKDWEIQDMQSEYIDKLKAENSHLRLLVEAITCGAWTGCVCSDVDGVNWFDARERILSGIEVSND